MNIPTNYLLSEAPPPLWCHSGETFSSSRPSDERKFNPESHFLFVYPQETKRDPASSPLAKPTASCGMTRKVGLLTFAFLLGCFYAPPPAGAQDETTGASGLPLPRFASLRADEINLRAGPGTRYPIEWVYRREGLPVEITAEYDIWRRIRDWEGSEGWVQKSALTGKRAAIIATGPKDLVDDPATGSRVLAHVATNAVGHVVSCTENWCAVTFGDIRGYMPKDSFWGTYANEVFD